MWATTWTAAAAAVLIAVGPVLSSRRTSTPVTRDTPEMSGISAFAPLGDAVEQPVRFTWSRSPDAVSYTITLSTPDGTKLWSAVVADTTVVTPSNIELAPWQDYVWFVDAAFSDGTSRSTGLREFRIAPQ